MIFKFYLVMGIYHYSELIHLKHYKEDMMKIGSPCRIYKYEIKPTAQQREFLDKMLGTFKKGKRSFVLREENSFTLNELEFRITDIPDPIEVIWTRFRPDIVNELTISQENTGRYYAVFKRDKIRENRLGSYPKSPRSHQSGIGRTSIHYHPK